MDLTQLRQFQTLARAENMTRAAQELQIDQPSLSRTLKRLETDLGVPLFDRTGRRIQLNPYGRAFWTASTARSSSWKKGRRPGTRHGSTRRGGDRARRRRRTLASRPVAGLRPRTRVRTVSASQRSLGEVRRLLELGQIDFGFSPAPMGSPCLRWRRLTEEEIFLVVPCGHRLDGRESVTLRDLAPEAMVMGGRGNVLRDLMDEACAQAGFAPRVTCEADDPAAIYNFVEAGLGVSFIPALVRRQRSEARQQNVSWLSIKGLPLRLTLGITWHEDRHLSEAAVAFRSFVARTLAAYEVNPSLPTFHELAVEARLVFYRMAQSGIRPDCRAISLTVWLARWATPNRRLRLPP